MIADSTLKLICQVLTSVKDRIRSIGQGVWGTANCLVEWIFELLLKVYFVHKQCNYDLQLEMTEHMYHHHHIINYRYYHYHHHHHHFINDNYQYYHHHTFCVIYSHIEKIGLIQEVRTRPKNLEKTRKRETKSLNLYPKERNRMIFMLC